MVCMTILDSQAPNWIILKRNQKNVNILLTRNCSNDKKNLKCIMRNHYVSLQVWL